MARGDSRMTSPPGRRILYIQFTNPGAYPALEHSARLLADRGWEARFIGTGASGSRILDFEEHPRISIRRLRFTEPGLKQKMTYLRFTAAILWATLRWKPTVIYVSDPLATPAARLASVLGTKTVVYHEHDAPSARSLSLFGSLVGWSRRSVARKASICVAPNEQRLEILQRDVPGIRRELALMNYPSKSEIGNPRENLRKGLRLVYAGSVVPHRLPVTVLEAIAKAGRNISLTIAGYETVGHPGYVSRLRQVAKDLGIGDRVRYAGPIPLRKDLLHLIATADVGLALMHRMEEDINLQTMVGASNKPFDYLTAGLAVLVTDDPDWKAMFCRPGYGRSCKPDDHDSIADALQWFAKNPSDTRKMGEAGRRRLLAEWNYETGIEPLVELLEGAS